MRDVTHFTKHVFNKNCLKLATQDFLWCWFTVGNLLIMHISHSSKKLIELETLQNISNKVSKDLARCLSNVCIACTGYWNPCQYKVLISVRCQISIVREENFHSSTRSTKRFFFCFCFFSIFLFLLVFLNYLKLARARFDFGSH